MRTYAILLIPIASYLVVAMLVLTKSTRSLLDAIVKTHILLFAFIAFSTEMLSIFGWLDYPHVLSVWGTACLTLILGFFRKIHKGFWFTRNKSLQQEFKPFIPGLTVIGFLLVATLLAGLLYPPNNWDSMTYHMARVANWINNGSVSFYPTAIDRQLYQMPLAEFVILHWQILSGSDVLANLVQWVCYGISICLVALIAKELGLRNSDQLLSSIVFATIPMAVLQASSTQNDLVVTCFILSFALFMLRIRSECNRGNTLFASLSLGLALLTKGTAWVYCGAIGLLLALPILNAERLHFALLTRRIGLLSLVVVLALVINSGHLMRNYQLYGKPFGSGAESYFIKDLSVPAVFGNTLRNAALHFGTPSERFNRYLYRALVYVLGEQLNNPNNTWSGTSFSIPLSRHEDTAGNPIHILFILFSLLTAFVWMRRQDFPVKCYVLGTFLAGLFYCVSLKWQPWASRLHTPVFAMSCPIILIFIKESFSNVRKYVFVPAVLLMVAFSLPFAANNQSRSLVSLEWLWKPRSELYFLNRPQLYESYKNVMDLVNMFDVQDVGMYLGEDDWEYPFWVLGAKGIRFHHVAVQNQSAHAGSRTAMPGYVIATKKDIDSLYEGSAHNITYSDENISLLMRK